MFERFQFYFKHSLNDLRVNGQRTFFALLCIAAGVAAIVSLQTLGVMINNTLTGSLQEVNKGDIRIQPAFEFNQQTGEIIHSNQGQRSGMLESQENGPDYFGERGIEMIRDWFEEHYPGSEITYQQAFVSEEELPDGISISAPERGTIEPFVQSIMIDSDLYPFYGENRTKEGELIGDVLREPTDVVISENLADKLEAEVGDTIQISGAEEEFVLRGIVPTIEEGGFENLLGTFLGYYYLDFRSRELFDLEPATMMVMVKLGEPSQTVEASEAFKDDYKYLLTVTTEDRRDENAQISSIVTDMVTMMGLISLLIGGIGIINTMLVIVSRRSVEVAVLKTLGLKPEEITILFLVEAVIMGILGSILGILLGFFLAYMTQGVAERFVAQDLTFTIAAQPAITGFIVGILITTIFGFLPTLVAGQVRPAIVLRPSDNVMPHAGRLLSFVATLLMIIALSLLTRGLVGELLTWNLAKGVSAALGAGYGLLIGGSMLVGKMLTHLTGRNLFMRMVRWFTLLFVLPIALAVLGYNVPALMVISLTFLGLLVLYLVLWVMIWSVGGGTLGELPLMGGLPVWGRWAFVIICIVIFAAIAFVGMLLQNSGPLFYIYLIPAVPIGFLTGLVILLILVILPFRLIGFILQILNSFLQRLGLVDLKIAMRSMLSAKGRGASTLLALVVGVFTLSLITMMVDTITNFFEMLVEDGAGGNVVIFPFGGEQVIPETEAILEDFSGTESYTVLRSYTTRIISVEDGETGEVHSFSQLRQIADRDTPGYGAELDNSLTMIDARSPASNLPQLAFYQGRQLRASDAGQPVVIIPANEATVAAGLNVGDKITFEVGSDGSTEHERVTLEVVGMTNNLAGHVSAEFTASIYTPLESIPESLPAEQTAIIAEVDEDRLRDLRRELANVPGAFMLETRLINDLITSLVNQFTSFPSLVAALALFTGGIVIANSVALSMMERRREIGIMKAVGLQRERVLSILLLENTLMGFVGGLIGVGVGFAALVFVLSQIFEGELGNTIPYATAFALMGLCILISLGAALMSVWGASGEKPLNVLRYE